MAAVTLILAAVGFGIASWTTRSEAASDKAVTKNDDSQPAITRTEEWEPVPPNGADA